MMKRLLTAEEAFQWGLVAKVVPQNRVLKSALEVAEEIKKMPPTSIRAIKKAVNNDKCSYEDIFAVLTGLSTTKIAKEGIRAFLEKREPEF